MTIPTTNCGKGSYHFPGMTEKEMEIEILERIYSRMEEYEKHLWSHLQPPQNGLLMDLGCGPGLTSVSLAERFPGSQIVGVDPSRELLAIAERRKKNQALGNLHFIGGDVYTLGLLDNTFDFIYSRFVFQHLADPREALRQIVRIMKPGRMLCVVDIDDDDYELHPRPSALDAFNERISEAQRKLGGDRHVGRKLGIHLRASGLTDVSESLTYMTSAEIGMKEFLRLTLDIKLPVVPPSQREGAIDELTQIYSIVQHSTAWGRIGLRTATGVKPKENTQ